MAARGLDVKDLVLVVNYDTPNHHEDYVHRCGAVGGAVRCGAGAVWVPWLECGCRVLRCLPARRPAPQPIPTPQPPPACPSARPPARRRVGRTGRAGAKGTAITFIGPDEEPSAPDLVKALRESGATIPQDLQVGVCVCVRGAWGVGRGAGRSDGAGGCRGWWSWMERA